MLIGAFRCLERRDHTVLIGSGAVLAELGLALDAVDFQSQADNALELALQIILRRVADLPGCRRISFEALGQRSLSPGSPAGWPDTSADWDGPSALLKRIAWADLVAQRLGQRNARELAPQLLGGTLGEDTAKAIARAESGAQAMTLLLAAPEFMRR